MYILLLLSATPLSNSWSNMCVQQCYTRLLSAVTQFKSQTNYDCTHWGCMAFISLIRWNPVYKEFSHLFQSLLSFRHYLSKSVPLQFTSSCYNNTETISSNCGLCDFVCMLEWIMNNCSTAYVRHTSCNFDFNCYNGSLDNSDHYNSTLTSKPGDAICDIYDKPIPCSVSHSLDVVDTFIIDQWLVKEGCRNWSCLLNLTRVLFCFHLTWQHFQVSIHWWLYH